MFSHRVYIEVREPGQPVACYVRRVRWTSQHERYVKIGRRRIFIDDPPAGVVFWKDL